MNKNASGRSIRRLAAIEDVELALETASWLAAWLVLPIWLAASGAGTADFLMYATSAGALLSLGVAADRPDGLPNAGDLAWFSAVAVLSILVVGGSFFAIAAAFR